MWVSYVCDYVCVCVGGGGDGLVMCLLISIIISFLIFYYKTALAFENNQKYTPHIGRNFTNPLSLKANLSSYYADYFNF